ncbi:hypothetical protein P3T76_015327 [Phytophthora citrophthora]|uniref:Mediator complex subunit 15 KIX domain-containing protein n=1 Tax=Phytophthora citrophthora TaxID=4793 RepID=A0AAD9LBI7_9STRA|nr:hypothetical protein P3T76_015327 [Phytophthora citrophthora]
MDPHSMGMQGGGMSMPMSMGMAGGGNVQAMGMGMGMNPQGMYNQPQQMMMQQQQQQQIPMGSMGMTQMNPSVMNPAQVSTGMQGPSTDWRIQLTREHRANLIAKIYNEMVRVSADPVPGIKLWMNVSWYELSLYKESPTQEVYINKIFTRLKSLRAQQSDMNAAMAAQGLPNQGMLSRLDFSYYNTLNLNQRSSSGAQVSSYPGHNQFSGPGPHPGTQQQQKPVSASNTPVKTETSMSASSVAEYWQQHAALRAKHQGDVEKVHSAFKKYVDHMKGHDETEQKKKLRYLLSYVELCANILSEDKATHPPRKIEELDKVFKYIVKIVNPYLKKLRTETDKRSYPSLDGSSVSSSGQPSTSAVPTAPGSSTSSGSSTVPANTSSGFSSAMTQPQSAGQTQQQNAVNTSVQMTAQQKQQQQYMMQQRAQQMQQQQQQQMQAQARQQQMMQQQQMMRQQQMQKGPQQQSQFSAQQSDQMNQQQQNSQNAANQQSGQQTQQQMGQQGPSRPQQPTSTQQQKPPQSQQPQQAQPQQNQISNQKESPSIGAGLSLGLDDSLYSSMGGDLLQMPTPSGTSSGLMDFSSALSPTFGGMDLLDWDDGTGQGSSGQGTSMSGDNSADLMTFVETL